jgi:hypothetical protein
LYVSLYKECIMSDVDLSERSVVYVGRLDFREVVPGVVKLDGHHLYAHDWREGPCMHCGGTGKDGRRKCRGCDGSGTRHVIDDFEDQVLKALPSAGHHTRTMATDLDEIRSRIRHGHFYSPGTYALVSVRRLTPLDES